MPDFQPGHVTPAFAGYLACATLAFFAYGSLVWRQAGAFRLTAAVHVGYMAFYFVLAPVLHVVSGLVVNAGHLEINLSDAFGHLLLLNAMGLAFAMLGFVAFGPATALTRRLAPIRYDRSTLLLLCATLAGIGVVAWLHAVISGDLFFIDPVTMRRTWNVSIVTFILAESVPMWLSWIAILLLMPKQPSARTIWLLVIGIVIVSVMFAGLRGSRNSIIVQIASALILIHLLLRPFRLRELVATALAGAAIFVIYSRFKYGGIDALLGNSGSLARYAEMMGNPLRVLLVDFGRADVQAIVLDNYRNGYFHPTFTGETYLETAFLVLPDSWQPDWIRSKTIVGSYAIFGVPWLDYDHQDGFQTSRIFGLLGEAVLNFGYWGIPFAFLVFGVVHRLMLAILAILNGALIFFAPLVMFLPMLMLFADLNNIAFFLIKNWALPILVVGTAAIAGSLKSDAARTEPAT